MELFFILPILLGFVVADLFFSDGSSNADSSDEDTAPESSKVVSGGSAEDETLRGASQADLLAGGAGDDKLEGGKAADVLLGEAGADQIFGGNGFDTLMGGNGDDTIQGGRGNDFILGGGGADVINGGIGDDTIVGTSGADKLEGGAGDDLISGIDIGDDLDVLAVNFVNTPARAEDAADAWVRELKGDFGTNAVPNQDARLVEAATSGNPNVDDDRLFGGRGNDTLVGDRGDTLTGGDGVDTFEVLSNSTTKAVTITDLNPAAERLILTVETGTNPAVTLVNGATPEGGVSVVIAGDTVAVLQGLTAADIPNGFIRVEVAT